MSEDTLIDIGWKEGFWFCVSGVLLVTLLYLADVGEFVASVRRANTSFFLTAVVIGFSSLLVWAWVWHRFFVKLSLGATLSQTVRMFLTGNFLNSITPLGQFGGEPIMAYIVSEATDADYENSLVCVISADILNATPFFTFTLGGIFYLAVVGSLRGPFVEIAVTASFLLVLFVLLAYLLLSDSGKLGDTLIGLVNAVESLLGRGESLFNSVRESIEGIEKAFEKAGSDPRFLITTAVISHLAILAQIVSLYFVFRSLGLPTEFVPIYLIVNLSIIATLSPTPGGSGTYEAAFAGLTTLFYSVDLATALTGAVLFRLTTYWPGILVGAVAFLTLRDEMAAEPEV